MYGVKCITAVYIYTLQVQHNVQEAREILSEGRFDKQAAKIVTAYFAACIV